MNKDTNRTIGLALGVAVGTLMWVMIGVALFSILGCGPTAWVQRPGVYVEAYPGRPAAWGLPTPAYVPRDPYRNLQVYRPGIDGPPASQVYRVQPMRDRVRLVPLGGPFRPVY